MQDGTAVSVIAIVGILAIELYALSLGMNGVGLTAAIGAIAGLGGWAVGTRKNNSQKI